jgi:coiled-coil domain-containing protein 55
MVENERKKSRGMASFYRNLLDEEETKHDEAVKAARKAALEGKIKPDEEVEVEAPREKKMADEAREINTKLGTDAVLINDEGEVVDKRQLLKSGLNVRPKAKPDIKSTQPDYKSEYEKRRAAQRDQGKERDARRRQQEVVKDQYETSLKRARDEESEKEEELKLRAKSKKTTDDVLSAKERYLARKAAAAQGL